VVGATVSTVSTVPAVVVEHAAQSTPHSAAARSGRRTIVERCHRAWACARHPGAAVSLPAVIVVGGEALVDLVIDREGHVAAKLGGGPFNAARTAGRLGSPVAFLGALSNDRFGQLLLAQLQADDVDVALVQFTELPTTLAAAELDDRGSATYRFYLADTSAPTVALDALPAGTRLFHVGTLGMVLEPMAATMERLVAAAADDVLVLLDPNCRPRVTADRPGYLARMARMVRRSDVVKVSTDDLEFIAPESHSEGIRALLEGGARVVLHTDGGDSVHVHSATQHDVVPVPKVTVVDTIGAGDSFGGAFAAWWHLAGLGRDDLRDHAALRAATEAAVEVAAINCTRAGAQPPRREELRTLWPTRL
jgi:fructokinase